MFYPGEVRVLAVLHRPAAREMLRRGDDGVRTDLIALQAKNKLNKQRARKIRVLAQRPANPPPPWLRRKINLRVQRLPQPNSNILPPRNLRKPPRQPRVPQRRDPHRLRPPRERGSQVRHCRVVRPAVLRVRGQGDGDAEAGVEGVLLELVLPGSDDAGVVDAAGEDVVGDVLFGDEGFDVVVEGVVYQAGAGVVHLASFLLEGHARQEVVHSLVDA